MLWAVFSSTSGEWSILWSFFVSLCSGHSRKHRNKGVSTFSWNIIYHLSLDLSLSLSYLSPYLPLPPYLSTSLCVRVTLFLTIAFMSPPLPVVGHTASANAKALSSGMAARTDESGYTPPTERLFDAVRVRVSNATFIDRPNSFHAHTEPG